MNKIISIIYTLSLLLFVSCGGAGSTNIAADLSENTEGAGTLVISSVTGNGSAENIFEDSLIIAGENFSSDMTVALGEYELTYTYNSDTQVTANLPEDITEGTYRLTLATSYSTASTDVTILQGEAGEDGEDGLTIAAQYYCGASSDLVVDANESKTGIYMTITKFSDGSYTAGCMTSWYNSTASLYDTSYSTSWQTASTTSALGYIEVIPFYVSCYYDIEDNFAYYENQLNTSEYAYVSCSQVYP